jgi:predicted RNA polymerase sigma factor
LMKMLRAEDALADALLAALNTWARDGKGYKLLASRAEAAELIY